MEESFPWTDAEVTEVQEGKAIQEGNSLQVIKPEWEMHNRGLESQVPIVTLAWYEVAMGAFVGTTRRIEALKRKLPDCNLKSDNNRWTDHLEGAAGEISVAKHLEIYWSGSVNTFRMGGDVGDYEVRSSGKHREMPIRERDKDEHYYVKAFGSSPNFRILGYIKCADAKNPDWWGDMGNGGPPCWWVPPEYLHPISELKEMIWGRCSHCGKTK